MRGANSKVWFLKAHTASEKQKWVKALGKSNFFMHSSNLSFSSMNYQPFSVSFYSSSLTINMINAFH